jgi:cellobiose phosphorylase
MVYDWMYGIRPTLDGLVIDPCLPSDFHDLSASIKYMNATVHVRISNPNGRQAGVKSMTVDGVAVNRTETDPFSRRTVFVAGDALFTKKEHRVEVVM